jgi:DNA-binding transcriptional regulator YhcF (GntR family)
MSWNFDSDRPIYLQLQEQIKLLIVSGVYSAGDKLPAVRDLAEETAVNPNTMQRALTELEREGLVQSIRTNGRYVIENTEVINKAKNELAMKFVNEYLKKMAAIGYDTNEATTLIKNVKEEVIDNGNS